MFDALQYVTSPLAFVAFIAAVIISLLLMLVKSNWDIPLKDIPRESRDTVAKQLLEIHRESTKMKHRLAWFLVLLFAAGLIYLALHFQVEA